jgi:hypothetical protein
MARYQPLAVQAQLAYDAAINSSCADWRAVAELFRAAVQAARTTTSIALSSSADRPALQFASWLGKPCSRMCRLRRGSRSISDGHCASRLQCTAHGARCRSALAFVITTEQFLCPTFSKSAAWKRTNCSTRERAMRIRRGSVQAVTQIARWRCWRT